MKIFGKGFTLIELTLTLVVVGVLAAILVPRFFDFSSDASQATVNNIAAALNNASAYNYHRAKTGATGATTINNCTAVANLLPTSHSMPSGYSIVSQPIAADAEIVCTVRSSTPSINATFVGLGVST